MTDSRTSEADPNLELEIEDWKPYVKAGTVGLCLIWFAVIAYLLFWPPSYTSTWGLLVLGRDPSVSIKLQMIGQMSSESPERPSSFQDPRDDYIYIATSLDTLTAAANRVDIDVEEFGEPDITAEKDSAIIAVEVKGKSPEEAQNKSFALYQVLFEKLESLRQQEIERRKVEIFTTLEEDQNTLTQVQNKIANFKSTSPFHSEDQLTSLSALIEGLRTKRAENIAALKGLEQRLLVFSKNTSVSEPEMHDAFILQADPVYQVQFEKYAEVFSRYSSLEAGLGSNNPTLLETKGELESTLTALKQRASFLLNKKITEKILVYLNSLEWVTSRDEYASLEAETNELENQITHLEQRLILLDQEQISFARVQADFQVAESILAGTLAKLNFNQDDIYSIYPPIQLIVKPNLPEEPSSPELETAFLAGVALSFILVTFLVFLKWERSSPWRNPRTWIP